ncbi:flagellar motor switch protein FliG [bacterium]|nr:flagellar motor switch protein FliG [bacterium]
MAKEKDSAPQKIDVSKMKPSQKVAALLILLGPGSSAEILKNIHDDEVLEQITLDIASMQKLPTEALEEIVNEFHTIFKASDMVSSGGMNYAKTLLEKAYGSEEADKILDRLVSVLNTNPFQFFNDADPVHLATSFQNENPQLIALILAYLKPEISAKVLNSLPPSVQAKVSLKIAQMESTNPEIISEVEKIVESRFSNVVVQDFSKVGGTATLASILNRTDRATEKNVIEMLEEVTPEVAENVRSLMFVFEDIINLEDKAIQRILREVESKDLCLALKGVRDDIKDKFLFNMSERAQAILLEEMEYLGPARAKDVQEMQAKIVFTIRSLESSGEIVIYKDSAEDELIE